MLSPEDVAKLQTEKQPFGCLIILIAALLGVGGLLAMFLSSAPIWIAAYVLAATAVFILYFNYRRRTNSLIDQDVWQGRKTIIVAPIESKRSESTEIKSGRRRGEMSLRYFMTVKGVEYKMNEPEYLEIRQGEFIELHIAPLSKAVISQRWLREDGTSVVINAG